MPSRSPSPPRSPRRTARPERLERVVCTLLAYEEVVRAMIEDESLNVAAAARLDRRYTWSWDDDTPSAPLRVVVSPAQRRASAASETVWILGDDETVPTGSARRHQRRIVAADADAATFLRVLPYASLLGCAVAGDGDEARRTAPRRSMAADELATLITTTLPERFPELDARAAARAAIVVARAARDLRDGAHRAAAAGDGARAVAIGDDLATWTALCAAQRQTMLAFLAVGGSTRAAAALAAAGLAPGDSPFRHLPVACGRHHACLVDRASKKVVARVRALPTPANAHACAESLVRDAGPSLVPTASLADVLAHVAAHGLATAQRRWWLRAEREPTIIDRVTLRGDDTAVLWTRHDNAPLAIASPEVARSVQALTRALRAAAPGCVTLAPQLEAVLHLPSP